MTLKSRLFSQTREHHPGPHDVTRHVQIMGKTMTSWGLANCDDSELQRVLERMRAIDDEHDAAERRYVDCHRETTLFRTLYNLCEQWRRRPNKNLGRFIEKTELLLLLHRRRAERNRERVWARKTPMDDGQQLELLCKHAGIAEAYQWVRVSEFR